MSHLLQLGGTGMRFKSKVLLQPDFPYTVQDDDFYLSVHVSPFPGAPLVINLPAITASDFGRVLIIKDAVMGAGGDAIETFPVSIDITPVPGNSIDRRGGGVPLRVQTSGGAVALLSEDLNGNWEVWAAHRVGTYNPGTLTPQAAAVNFFTAIPPLTPLIWTAEKHSLVYAVVATLHNVIGLVLAPRITMGSNPPLWNNIVGSTQLNQLTLQWDVQHLDVESPSRVVLPGEEVRLALINPGVGGLFFASFQLLVKELFP